MKEILKVAFRDHSKLSLKRVWLEVLSQIYFWVKILENKNITYIEI